MRSEPARCSPRDTAISSRACCGRAGGQAPVHRSWATRSAFASLHHRDTEVTEGLTEGSGSAGRSEGQGSRWAGDHPVPGAGTWAHVDGHGPWARPLGSWQELSASLRGEIGASAEGGRAPDGPPGGSPAEARPGLALRWHHRGDREAQHVVPSPPRPRAPGPRPTTTRQRRLRTSSGGGPPEPRAAGHPRRLPRDQPVAVEVTGVHGPLAATGQDGPSTPCQNAK